MTPITKEQALAIGAKHSTPTQFGREFSEAQWMAAVQDIAKLGHNAGLDEAICLARSANFNAGDKYGHGYNKAAAEITRAITSLKGNTP